METKQSNKTETVASFVDLSHEQLISFGYERDLPSICITPGCNKNVRGTSDRGTPFCQAHYRKIKCYEKIHIEIEQRILEIGDMRMHNLMLHVLGNSAENTVDEFHRLKTQRILLQLELYKNYHGIVDSDLFPNYYSLDPNCVISAKCSNCERGVLHEYPLCKFCSRLLHKIEVKKSTIHDAGLGVFAYSLLHAMAYYFVLSNEVVFKRGEYIGFNMTYEGDELD
ncbi:hypothetical protein HK096_002498 [Nowakowskiella sp. JEL0078]|nr:hypothetical protein HK096_002498 [Nowakowskiella sp. JEL0078]